MPIDDDVRPFSILNPVGSDSNRNNRRHHFISAVYMDGFADERGRVQVNRCEGPEALHPMNPRAIGFERDYSSQKLPDGPSPALPEAGEPEIPVGAQIAGGPTDAQNVGR